MATPPGAAVSADDFVYAWRRALAPETASGYAFILWPIDGAESYSKGAQKDPASIGVKALDPQTLEVHLKAPTPYFLGMLMHHMAYPLPKAVVEKFGKDWTKLDKEPQLPPRQGSWCRHGVLHPHRPNGLGDRKLAGCFPQFALHRHVLLRAQSG